MTELRRDLTELTEFFSNLKKLANDELKNTKSILKELEKDIRLLLLPKDEADEKNAILEVRAGTGGEEAALFAANLFRMYQRLLHKTKL